MAIKKLYLKSTTFNEFKKWCDENKNRLNYGYVTDEALKVVYDHYVKRDLKIQGDNLKMSCNDNERISSYSSYGSKPTRDDFVWEMFHEIWCKTEWAVRCGSDERCGGYSYVISEFGKKKTKELVNAGSSCLKIA